MKLAIALLLSVVGFLTVHPSLARDLPATNTGAAHPPTKYKIDERGGGYLATTTGKLQVLSAPKAGSPVLDEYDKGATMAVVGEATGTGYLYVSPCNACKSGFVSKTEFQAKTKR